MKNTFKVEPIKFSVITELNNAWTNESYKELLEIMDYGDSSDLSESELKEMCLLSLSDNEPEDAAKIVLEYIFKDRLNDGQIQNLSNEMLEENTWEEYADLSLHEEFFNVHQLLYDAYNGKFPHPEAVNFKVKVTANNADDLLIFKKDMEAPLIRLLVKGMPDNTLINRLFKDDLMSENFKDAQNIIWQLTKVEGQDNTITFEIISSSYWFHDFKYAEEYEGVTHTDEA